MIFRRDPLADPETLIRRVYAYVAYRIGDGPDAEDVTSETFERAIRYRDSYDRSKGEPVAWLIGIARRVIAGRGGGTPEVLMADLPEVAAVAVSEDAIVGGLTVRAAVAGLEERERELIALRYGADLSAAQIGEVLGIRVNTVEVALHRVRNRLATKLQGSSDDERPDSEVSAVRI
jgi:DNA-directed RNA polymerase specialized sigma24 family protein